MKKIISTENAPAAIGPYSQAVTVDGFVYTSGQIPIDPATKAVVSGGIREQAEQVMKNLEAVLAASGSSPVLVIKTTCFLQDLADFGTFNEVYAGTFGESLPARSTVQVARLPMDVLVEVECIARVS
jgi:2-iminobutanoate/2-iminopropanoate deaminase